MRLTMRLLKEEPQAGEGTRCCSEKKLRSDSKPVSRSPEQKRWDTDVMQTLESFAAFGS